MTGWIDWLRKLDWVQWLALVALACAYICIAIPFLGIVTQRSGDVELLLLFLCSAYVALVGRRAGSATSGASGMEHVGGVAIIMMALWTLPAWPFPRPQQPNDFMIYLWSFIVLASATRILSARPSVRDNTAGGATQSLA